MSRLYLFLSVFIFNQYITAQNVGIGTNNPLSKLHVAGCIRSDTLIGVGVRNLFTTPNGRIYDSLVIPSTLNWQINGNSNITPANFLGTTNAQDLIFKTNNVENMRVLNTNGNVGIGTPAPGAQLEVVLTSNTTAASISRFSRQGTGSVGWMSLFSGAAASDWNGMTQTGDKSFIFTNDNNPSASDNSGLVIAPWTTAGNPAINSGIKIMENGNVGISVGAPTKKLEITSDVNAAIYATRNFNGIANSDAGFIGGIDAAYTNTGVYFVQKDNISLGSFNTNLINVVSNGTTQALINGAGNMRVGTASYPTQCGGVTAPESATMKFAVMNGFSSFGNFNNDPVVNANPPATTWAGGVGALALGMNRQAGTSNVDLWNNTDPNNGAAATGITDRGFNFRNFQTVAGSCAEKLLMTLDGNGNLTLSQFTGAGGTANAYAFNTISDQRVKRNIKALDENMTQKIMQLKPVTYEYANINYEPHHKLEILGSSAGKTETGFLAQDVYQLFPQSVHKPEDESKELWAIDYSKLVPVLIKAFQEQQIQIEALKKEVENLKSGQK